MYASINYVLFDFLCRNEFRFSHLLRGALLFNFVKVAFNLCNSLFKFLNSGVCLCQLICSSASRHNHPGAYYD